MDDRLPTYLLVEACMRACSAQALPFYVIHKGERNSGVVLMKSLSPGQGCKLLIQQRDLEGKMTWMAALKEEIVSEEEADSYIARSTSRDPDLWVIEVESAEMLNPFEFDGVFQ